MELESYLVQSVSGIVSIAKDKYFRDKALLQTQALCRHISENFSASEQQQILSILAGNALPETGSPRINMQSEIILDHLKSLQEKALTLQNVPFLQDLRDNILPYIWKKAGGFIIAGVVLVLANVMLYGFGTIIAPAIWTSSGDRSCQEHGYWYSGNDSKCHAWYISLGRRGHH